MKENVSIIGLRYFTRVLLKQFETFVFSLLLISNVGAQTPILNLVYEGIDRPTHIVSNTYDPGLYISSLSGEILYFSDFNNPPVISQIPNVNDTIRNNGLFGMAFHPEYPDSNYIYVHYTYCLLYTSPSPRD